ncbi:MAG: hypothetical protein CR982_04220 [Candidatus Cloacimonadota bacterium]|nr:MAG: hypothetical protein CR982_04220 [Candidatus Cloacimonadota bacterium]PIE78485.1 MAG: hypothetical protein CSA15_07260 [Candidatus Delongbacteria bacterium]
MVSLNAAKYAGEFLKINPDVRSEALGGAGCASTNSFTSFRINPSNILRDKHFEIYSQYSSLYGPIDNSLAYYHYIGINIPINSLGSAVSLSWVRLGVEDIPYFPNYSDVERWKMIEANNGEPGNSSGDKYFTDREDAFFLTLAKSFNFTLDLGWDLFKLPITLNSGLNVKYINISLADRTADGLGFDGGISLLIDLNTLSSLKNLNPLKLGFSVKDFNKTGISWSDTAQDAIPISMVGGIEYTFSFRDIDTDITLLYDHNYETETRTTSKNYGGEILYNDLIALRVGSDNGTLVFGGGLSYLGLYLGYSYSDRDLGIVNKASLAYSF